jgi:hypothetical protein
MDIEQYVENAFSMVEMLSEQQLRQKSYDLVSVGSIEIRWYLSPFTGLHSCV